MFVYFPRLYITCVISRVVPTSYCQIFYLDWFFVVFVLCFMIDCLPLWFPWLPKSIKISIHQLRTHESAKEYVYRVIFVYKLAASFQAGSILMTEYPNLWLLVLAAALSGGEKSSKSKCHWKGMKTNVQQYFCNSSNFHLALILLWIYWEEILCQIHTWLSKV